MKYIFKWLDFNLSNERKLLDLGKNINFKNLKSSSVFIDPTLKVAMLTLQFSEENSKIQEEVVSYFDSQKVLRPTELHINNKVIQIPVKPSLIASLFNLFSSKEK